MPQMFSLQGAGDGNTRRTDEFYYQDFCILFARSLCKDYKPQRSIDKQITYAIL